MKDVPRGFKQIHKKMFYEDDEGHEQVDYYNKVTNEAILKVEPHKDYDYTTIVIKRKN